MNNQLDADSQDKTMLKPYDQRSNDIKFNVKINSLNF